MGLLDTPTLVVSLFIVFYNLNLTFKVVVAAVVVVVATVAAAAAAAAVAAAVAAAMTPLNGPKVAAAMTPLNGPKVFDVDVDEVDVCNEMG